jgi:hypothetical protein
MSDIQGALVEEQMQTSTCESEEESPTTSGIIGDRMWYSVGIEAVVASM